MQNELKVMLTAGSGGESQQCHKRGDFSLLFSRRKWLTAALHATVMSQIIVGTSKIMCIYSAITYPGGATHSAFFKTGKRLTLACPYRHAG